MVIVGISEGFHDASLSIIDNDKIVFAGHAERYSKQKNDAQLNHEIFLDAYSQININPEIVAYYEKPLLKKARLILKGGIEDSPLYYKKAIIGKPKEVNIKHHKSHAAAGYYTSKFDDAVVVVLDAIGEFETSTIWVGEGDKLKQVYSKKYPFSFGLFYSAFTHLLGLKPNQEEYIMMGMAAYGDPKKYWKKIYEYFPSINEQKYNFHKGIYDWNEPMSEQDKFDIAASVQKVYELRLMEFMRFAAAKTQKNNLVFMGGCALNSKANTLLWDIFEDVWIMPNPGDAGSSLGAALAVYGKHIDWQHPYLGTNIPGEYPVDKTIKALLTDKIAPVATGRAEFGPRSLGNRSILADPRDPNIKDKVNLIKQRELFRPFAPVVLEEYASEWFDMKYSSPYMQYTPRCLKPDLIPSVVHEDGTSRVQTVNKQDHPGLYELLSQWNKITGIPVLLNTSLNIKGQPIINDIEDIRLWEDYYKKPIIH
jgi:carbamoyltransferase